MGPRLPVDAIVTGTAATSVRVLVSVDVRVMGLDCIDSVVYVTVYVVHVVSVTVITATLDLHGVNVKTRCIRMHVTYIYNYTQRSDG